MPDDLLTDRDAGDVLFALPGRSVDAGCFAADALRLADALPPGGYAVNLCTGRYAFAVGFAAALLRGCTSLLTGDRNPAQLQRLQARFAGAYALTDGAGAGQPLPAIPVPAPGRGRAAIPAIAGDALAALVFTSGSTGEPACHAKSWSALVARSRAGGAAFALAPGAPASIVASVPPQHMYGFETSVLLPLHAPCAAWCGPAFYPADIRAALDAMPGPRLLVTTPLQLRVLMQAMPALPHLAGIISATAPLDTAMAGAAERQWATVVSEIFGATEVGSIAARRTAGGPEWTLYPGVALHPAGDSWLVRAPGADDTALDDALDVQADGRFVLLGRRSDLVKLGGRRASLTALNRALAAVAGVQDGAFLPPDAGDLRAAARMTAFVVAPGLPAAAIVAALRDRVDPLFLPRRIVHVDRLPRNPLGKLPVAALRALLADA